MKRLLILSLILVTATIYGQQPLRVTCSPPEFKTQNRQYRGDVKHRSRGAQTGTGITVAGVYDFPSIDSDTVNSDANSSRPVAGTQESRTFTLDAFLRQAKVEGNDCEIHLEFSDTARTNARRIIVEIPPDADFSSDYQTILRLVHSRFPRRRVLGPGVAFGLIPAVHMKITGFGFFDGFHARLVGPHKPNGGHGSANVKTFWELHPAWNVRCIPETDCP